MAIQAGVGSSKNKDSYKAGYEAYQQAAKNAAIDKSDVVIVFSSIAFDQKEVVRGVREASGNSLLVGCSTAGEITNDGPAKNSIAVMALKADTIDFVSGVGKGVKADSRKAGRDVAQEVKKQAGDKLRVFMSLTDGLSGNGSEVVRGILDELGKHFVIVGGGAGDDARYKETYQYMDDSVFSDSVVGLGLSGNFKYSVGVKHGWVPIGTPMRVTKSEGSILHELDGKPAIQLYKDYFGEEKAKEIEETVLAELALSYPIGIKVPESDEFLLRAPFFVDKKGSITCGGEVPEGSEVRLMLGSREEAIAAARSAAKKAVDELDGKPKAVLIFNCHVRDKFFRKLASQEISAIQEIVGKDTPMLGIYTYSEQAPLAGETRNIEACKSAFHNETVVIFILGE